jgi:tetratricopeptide (TPR) repeat protein
MVLPPPEPYVYNKQRSRSEDVVDIPSTATTNRRLSCPSSSSRSGGSSSPRNSPSSRKRSERKVSHPQQQSQQPHPQPQQPCRPLYKSQSERRVVLQPPPNNNNMNMNTKPRSRSQDFVDAQAPSKPIQKPSNRRNSLPPNRERIHSDFESSDHANRVASQGSDVSCHSSAVVDVDDASIGRRQQLAPKKHSSERNLPVFTRSESTRQRLRCRSEDLVDVPNRSHQQLQVRNTNTNTRATAAAAAPPHTLPIETPARRKRSPSPVSPTSVMDVSSASMALAREESQQQPKLPTISPKKATLDELLHQAFGFESQGNPLLALQTYRAALDVSKRRHRSTCNKLIHAHIYHRMGLLHYQMGNYHPSLRVLEQALETIELSYGCLTLEDTLTLISGIRNVCELVTEISLAVARVHLSLGSIQDAKQAAKQGLEIVHNKRDSQVLFHKGLVVLGMVYELEGRLDNALSHYQQALAFQQHHYQHHVGDHHHHTSVAATISCIGNVYTKQGWMGPAMECFRESIRMYSLSKSSSLDIGLTLASIGWIQWWCGDLESATKSTSAALYIVQAGLGDLHRNTCTIRYQLGLIQARQGHYREALGTLRCVLHAQRLSLGDDHDDIAITCDAIGDLYQHQLHTSNKAATFFSKALNVRKRVWGKTHLLVATSYSRLGHVLERIGNHSESRAYLAKTLGVYHANQLPLQDFRVQQVQQALDRMPAPPSELVPSS